jgi:hypothetical protein
MAEDAVSSFTDMSLGDGKQWLEERLLGKVVRVTLKDARIVIGEVACIEAKGGLYLCDADEYLPEQGLGRYLNCVIVPEQAIAQLEVRKD